MRLEKPCPKCDSRSLKIIKDQVKIIPIYECKKCNEKSYYLTTNYLKFLVYTNKTLFEKNELEELEHNEQEFIHELKEYISRIFATKKINRIK